MTKEIYLNIENEKTVIAMRSLEDSDIILSLEGKLTVEDALKFLAENGIICLTNEL